MPAFYIIQPSPSEERPETAPEVGEGSWHELMTTDAPAAMQFYSEVFGWQPSETMDMGPMGKYHMFNRPHAMTCTPHGFGPGEAPVDAYWVLSGARPTLFIGDLAYNDFHLYMGGDERKRYTAQWLRNIDMVAGRHANAGRTRSKQPMVRKPAES